MKTQGQRSEARNHPNPVSGKMAPGRFRSVRGTDRPDTFEKEGLKKEEHTRHPELVSGPRASESDDSGKRHGVLKQVQDDEQ
jgi:hypothetical protein